jgi:hypothetical protein
MGGCNYRRRAEYVLRQTIARRQKMDAVDDRPRRHDTSLLSGHLTPTSETRDRVDAQARSAGRSHSETTSYI